ncbi:MAG: radical SAM/SPASM domain-containing protein [Magnetospirillum sp.]|nr:radical SAM/SPASM domain-containing protein [Magnetospirillum sp.]
MSQFFTTCAHVVRRRALIVGGRALSNAPAAVKRGLFRVVCRRHAAPFAGSTPKLFETVYFELRTRCNGSCGFCTASVQNDTRPDTRMSRELFEALVGQLAALNFSGRVCFHVNNDPLIVPGIEDFVAFARHSLPQAYLQILTNGRALNNALGERLLDAGIDELSINWYAADVDSPLPRNLVAFRDEVITHRQTDTGLRPVSFNIYRRKITEVLTNRGGTAPNKSGLKGSNPFGFCVFPFTQLNVTADGRVSKCCSDVQFADAMGDLTQQSILDVWRGPRFAAVRRALMAGDRSAVVHCRECDFIGIRPGTPPRWSEQLAQRVAKDIEDH